MPRFKLTLRVLAVIIFLVSLIWLIVDPGFEPLIGFLGAVVAYLGSLSDEKREPSAEDTARQIAETRRTLLDGIYNDVVNNRLAGTLEDEIRAELKLTFQPKAVVNRTGKVDGKEQTIQEDADVINVFQRAGGKLLILGAPGAGKTTTLLRLAKMLLEKAQKDDFLPVPVIFELSEWAQERKPLAEWLPQVIGFRTQAKPERWKDWFLPEKPRILPLLDGLDEVPAEHRAECVQRINEFSAALTMKVIVCSRSIEYEQLGEKSRLVLNGAVEIEPLTEDMIRQYLKQLGDKVKPLSSLLDEDKDLHEMAAQPLLLNMMVLAYQQKELKNLNTYLQEFQKLEQEFAAKLQQESLINTQTEQKLNELFQEEKVAIRRRHIFARFLDTRFEMALNPEARHQKDDTLTWLHWLAKQMTQRDLQAFFIEDLQPDWLRDEQQKSRYYDIELLAFRLVSGLFFGLLCGLFFYLLLGLMGYLLFGLLLGLLYGWEYGRLSVLGILNNGKIKPIENLRWSTPDILFEWRSHLKSGSQFGLSGGLLSGLLFGLEANRQFGLLSGLSFGLVFSLAGGTVFSVAIFVTSVLWQGYTAAPQIKTQPNEGIYLSWHNGRRFILISSFIWGLALGLALGLAGGLVKGFTFGLVLGLAGGLVSGLIGVVVFSLFDDKGTKAVIQHIVPRIMLTREGSAPMNYAAFLEECVRRKIMIRSGNGYKFLHRLLQEHIAVGD